MNRYPSPHTEAWLMAVEALNPDQAAVTSMLVRFAGRPDVCSLCGDHPAHEYQLLNEPLSPAALPTLRLCLDCHNIQSVPCGEKFVRLPCTGALCRSEV